MASARGLVVLTLNSQSLAHIDAARRRVVATAGVGGSPGTLAVTADDLWVTQHCGEGGPGSVFRYVMGSDGAINITDADEISLAGKCKVCRVPGSSHCRAHPGCSVPATTSGAFAGRDERVVARALRGLKAARAATRRASPSSSGRCPGW